MGKFAVAILLILFPLPGLGDELKCGQVKDGHQGKIEEWPNKPVNFSCKRGFSELSLCILNRTGIEWLPNAGPQFVAISDGDAIYALTRDNHSAYPMIVRREVKEVDGSVVIQTTGCGYGEKEASDKLIESYKALDQKLMEEMNGANQE